jgi:hypothetical protein
MASGLIFLLVRNLACKSAPIRDKAGILLFGVKGLKVKRR